MLVAITVVFTLIIGDDIEKLLSLNGAIFCTPVAFLFPASFHLKACANSKFQKAVDISIICLSVVIMIYCTYAGIAFWNTE